MKLESKNQQVLPLQRFMLRMSRYVAFSILLLSISISAGTFGYHQLDSLNWVDFHMACMILTGMGPVAEMKTGGAKIFSSLFALYSGVAFLSITAVFFAPIVHRLLHILHVEDNN